MNVRVVTLNVWNDEGSPDRIGRVNRELRRLRPDLVAFQEITHAAGREQLPRLLEGTGLAGKHQSEVQAAAPPFADRYGGTAVASRWPLRVVEVLDLRVAGARDVPWATLAASVEVPSLGPVLFITAATSWRLAAEAAREQQAVAIADLDARHRQELPSIIAGDFNAAPDSASIRFLTGRQSLNGRSVHYHDAWAIAGEGPGFTWSHRNPNAAGDLELLVRQPGHERRIDYVLVGGADAHPRGRARVKAASLCFDAPVDGEWASDHFGVMADLEVEKVGAAR